jgi:hypothetical protein
VGFVIKSLYSNDLEFRTLKLCSKCNCELENYKNLDGVLVFLVVKAVAQKAEILHLHKTFVKFQILTF